MSVKKVLVGLVLISIILIAGAVTLKARLFNSVLSADIESVGSVSVGNQVLHSKYGKGVVEETHQNEGSHSIIVNFDNYGKKWLIAQYAALKLVVNTQ